MNLLQRESIGILRKEELLQKAMEAVLTIQDTNL